MPTTDNSSRSIPHGKPGDPETRWNEIVDLRDPDKQKQAMAVLLERYDAVIRWRLAADLRCGGKDLGDAYGDFVLWVLREINSWRRKNLAGSSENT